jgi:hypothetical protein
MAFKKGESGNPRGRKKGTPNKTTSEIKTIIKDIVFSNFSKIKIARDLKELSPKQRMDYFLRLIEFIVPKPKSTECENDRPLNMDEKYSMLTEYIHNNFSYNVNKSKENDSGNGRFVTIYPADIDGNGCVDGENETPKQI